jgi:isopenicillin N synthase-like dioxygenase
MRNAIFTITEYSSLWIGDDLIEGGYMKRESFYADDGSTNSNLRILQYRPKESCRFLAKPHTDRGIFTLTVYETHSGLRFYLPDGTIEPIAYEEYRVKMFPTDFWSKYVSVPLTATTHDVVKKDGNTERGSMVLFVNPAFDM